jgi:hypothetical protein
MKFLVGAADNKVEIGDTLNLSPIFPFQPNILKHSDNRRGSVH